MFAFIDPVYFAAGLAIGALFPDTVKAAVSKAKAAAVWIWGKL